MLVIVPEELPMPLLCPLIIPVFTIEVILSLFEIPTDIGLVAEALICPELLISAKVPSFLIAYREPLIVPRLFNWEMTAVAVLLSPQPADEVIVPKLTTEVMMDRSL
ncbi:MAG: hypothetical protein BVN35_00015 [Proteobacteria bacterium ST_bin11]|nr:MAG: hypothetical protein BVN35_00015 [Proteobacteria bacterium ST_bin11]